MSLRNAAVISVLGLAVFSSANSAYLALGDSVAFGLQPDAGNPYGYNVPSNGDRGYVVAVADALGVGSTRPTVLNLSIPRESSTSFFDTTNTLGAANSNYGLGPTDIRTVSQSGLAALAIGAYGSSIETVSFALGANDFLSLTGLLNLTSQQVSDAFDHIDAAYSSFLSALRSPWACRPCG